MEQYIQVDSFTTELWDTSVVMPTIKDLEVKPVIKSYIKKHSPEEDGYVFLHGVALTRYKGRFYAAWGHNKECENSAKEVMNYAVSTDGMHWEAFRTGVVLPEKDMAVSHGVFMVKDDVLWYFAPIYKGDQTSEMLETWLYRYDLEKECFVYEGVAVKGRFWPMAEPVLMENGNYIMPGLFHAGRYMHPTDDQDMPAVAISDGNNIRNWRMIKLTSLEEGLRVWGECGVLVKGNQIRLISRSEHGLPSLVSESDDFGESWTQLSRSNLPMIDSKPYCGKLPDGRFYLLCSCAADITMRSPLTIALTEPDSFIFHKVYALDLTPHSLGYPYAYIWNDVMYVGYSDGWNGNHTNNAVILQISLKDL